MESAIPPYQLDWKAIFAGAAFLLGLFNLWYTLFRRGTLLFSCSRWTSMAAFQDDNKPGFIGAAFSLEIDVVNTGSRPFVLRDLFLEASTTSGEKWYYEPIFLFDLSGYVQTVGQGKSVLSFQRAQVPMPISVPKSDQFAFPHALLFLPMSGNVLATRGHDKVTVRLFALTDAWRKYRQVATQEFGGEPLNNLSLGSFYGALPTASIAKRQNFIALRTTGGVGRFSTLLRSFTSQQN